jgi:hypothetical protein
MYFLTDAATAIFIAATSLPKIMDVSTYQQYKNIKIHKKNLICLALKD